MVSEDRMLRVGINREGNPKGKQLVNPGLLGKQPLKHWAYVAVLQEKSKIIDGNIQALKLLSNWC